MSTLALKQLEASLEAYFRKSVREKLGGRVVKLAPTEKGVPDRLVLLPGGRMFLVELKADGGRLSPAQVYWHENAKELGTTVHVLEGRGQIYQWCIDRMEDIDGTVFKAARSEDYNRGYKAGVKHGMKRAGEMA